MEKNVKFSSEIKYRFLTPYEEFLSHSSYFEREDHVVKLDSKLESIGNKLFKPKSRLQKAQDLENLSNESDIENLEPDS